MSERSLTFATQGGEFSYHAEAARRAAQDDDVHILPMDRFGEVIRASRSQEPGLGVIAISTAAGTVDASAAEIVRKRPSALPPIIGRVDIPIELSLIGGSLQSLEDLNRRGVKCLAQKAASVQCVDFLKEELPWIKIKYRGESTRAIKEALDKKSNDWVAIGPRYAAAAMGGVILGPEQINPSGSITSFYILQRNPRQELLPRVEENTEPRTVISLALPEGQGEFEKCAELAEKLDIQVARFIRFDIGDFTKHGDGRRRGGGLLEVSQDRYDENVTEFCARINSIEANDGAKGPFATKVLGDYKWRPEPCLALRAIDYNPAPVL